MSEDFIKELEDSLEQPEPPQPPPNPQLITHGNLEIDISSNDMQFNETNLNEYIMKEGAIYNNKCQEMADLEYLYSVAEDRYETAYHSRFAFVKEDTGNSDKWVEAKVKSDPELVAMRQELMALKRDVSKMKTFLKSWDKNHENAQSFGHNLRKEMEKLGSDIKFRSDPELESRLESKLNWKSNG